MVAPQTNRLARIIELIFVSFVRVKYRLAGSIYSSKILTKFTFKLSKQVQWANIIYPN